MSARRRADSVLLLAALLGLAACSDGSASPAPGAQATQGTQATQVPTSAADPTGSTSPTAAEPATGPDPSTGPAASEDAEPADNDPTAEATCTAVTTAQVGRLLGTQVQAGLRDQRAGTEGQRQIDGCSYTGPDGVQLSYLVWSISVAGTEELVEKGLPPASDGVMSFSPDLGAFSAGAVISNGPVATAQVNTARKRRLVQVSVTAAKPAAARSAATAVAAALIDR